MPITHFPQISSRGNKLRMLNILILGKHRYFCLQIMHLILPRKYYCFWCPKWHSLMFFNAFIFLWMWQSARNCNFVFIKISHLFWTTLQKKIKSWQKCTCWCLRQVNLIWYNILFITTNILENKNKIMKYVVMIVIKGDTKYQNKVTTTQWPKVWWETGDIHHKNTGQKYFTKVGCENTDNITVMTEQ